MLQHNTPQTVLRKSFCDTLYSSFFGVCEHTIFYLAVDTVNIFMSHKNKKRSIFDQPNGKGRCWCFFAQATRFRDLQDYGSGSHSMILDFGKS